MKSYRKELWFNIPARRKIVRITEDVQKAIDESGIREGLVLVNAMNITATALCQLSILQLLMIGAVTRYYDRFHEKSRLQLKISDLDRYDMKQKEITVNAVRSDTEN